MALSMDEQRMLAEIERRLAAENPGLASDLTSFRKPSRVSVLRSTRARVIGSLFTVVVVAMVSLMVYAMLPFRSGGRTVSNHPVTTTSVNGGPDQAKIGVEPVKSSAARNLRRPSLRQRSLRRRSLRRARPPPRPSRRPARPRARPARLPAPRPAAPRTPRVPPRWRSPAPARPRRSTAPEPLAGTARLISAAVRRAAGGPESRTRLAGRRTAHAACAGVTTGLGAEPPRR